MVRVSIQLKMALGLSVLILIALLWKIPEPLQDDSLWTDKIAHILIFYDSGNQLPQCGHTRI